MIVAGTADVFVDQAGPVGLGLFAVLAVVEDGCDRGVGARAKRQCPGAGGIEAFRAVALLQPQDADAGADPAPGAVASAG